MTLDLSGLHSSFEPPQRPAITPQQRTMIQNLNAALDAHPRATKHLSFLPNVWTSHQVLIVQDAKDAEHRAGESAVRHWADHFMF
ncbi:hypothetical protein DL93DRAFT_2078737 [Clavulina sp. PMI_390]|nr:hypothetical protein DL93DRAFT_2078737 [Clavulina sp. PMI_390]